MFGFICNWFKKKQVERKVILVGHNVNRQGARVMSHGTEYLYNSKVAHIIKNLLPEVEVSFFNEIENDFVVVADPGFIAIELHCNAFNGYVKGSEVLILEGDTISKEYATELLDSLCNRFSKHNRGVKELKEGDKGFNNLKRSKRKGARVSIIVEPFFGDNQDDVISAPEYADWIVDWFNNEE